MKTLKYFILLSLLSCSNISFGSNIPKGNKLPQFERWSSLLLSLLDSSRAVEKIDMRKSLHFAGQAMSYADSLGHADLIVKVYNQYGRIYFSSGLVENSTSYYLKAYEMLNSEQNIPHIDRVSTLIGMGINYLFLKIIQKPNRSLRKQKPCQKDCRTKIITAFHLLPII